MQLKPKHIVEELDKYIIGQNDAKKSVAIALRNRWRRQQVPEPLRSEITPKNILMIGPTGVGKTEIARRLAKLSDAPFIKVEATKFTEVGYVGKDVESIIRDLIDISFKSQREKARQNNMAQAEIIAENKILEILVPQARTTEDSEANLNTENQTKERFRQMLKEGKLDDKEVEIEVSVAKPRVQVMGPPAFEEIASQLQDVLESSAGTKKQKQKLKVPLALKALAEDEAVKLINEEEIKRQSVQAVEQHGIVFIDEIDKVAIRSGRDGVDVSRSGVQRDLLPLVEGTTVSTKYGMIKTDHILFIASGAFHIAKPSDLLPELQGRFPIRVELSSLTIEDFEKILTSTENCLIEQYKALLGTENAVLNFMPDGIRKIAEIAFEVNERTENIGARRLYTIMERLLEDISFDPETNNILEVDAKHVSQKLEEISKSEDLSRYVL